MTRTFIQTHEFTRNWERLGLKDQDLRRLELQILKNLKAGKVIIGTGGLRKLRFAFENEEKVEAPVYVTWILSQRKRYI